MSVEYGKGFRTIEDTSKPKRKYEYHSQEAIDNRRRANMENFTILRLKGIIAAAKHMKILGHLEDKHYIPITIAAETAIKNIKYRQQARKPAKKRKDV